MRTAALTGSVREQSSPLLVSRRPLSADTARLCSSYKLRYVRCHSDDRLLRRVLVVHGREGGNVVS